jgi:hypothetical protein
MQIQSPAFRFRGFITLLVFSSFLVALVSGIALYVRPEGSLARWTSWTLAGMDKMQWESAHTGSVILFIFSCLVHLWYNFRHLVSCLKSKAALVFASGARLPFCKEMFAAIVVTVLVLVGAVEQWPGLSKVHTLRAQFKDGLFTVRVPPPVLDADQLTLAAFCQAAAIEPEQALANARRRGVVVEDLSLNVSIIAQKNNITPEDVFIALRGD